MSTIARPSLLSEEIALIQTRFNQSFHREEKLQILSSLRETCSRAISYVQHNKFSTDPSIHREVQKLTQILDARIPLIFEKTIQHMSKVPSGLRNQSANCWANSLLQMLKAVPSLGEAFQVFALEKKERGTSEEDRRLGRELHETWNRFLSEQGTVSSVDTQRIRLALHHFFPGHFSANPSSHEDAHEALICILGGYEEICQRRGIPLSGVYQGLETCRHYTQIANTDASPQPRAYEVLVGNNTKLRTIENQILLEPRSHFSDLLVKYFAEDQEMPQHEPVNYLGADGRAHQYKPHRITRRYLQTPQELVVTLKRFGQSSYGELYKIQDNCSIPRYFTLPKEATPSAETPVHYALDAFIVHRGYLYGGHYVAYQRQGDTWFETNDASVRKVSESEIDSILKKSYIHHYRKVDRIPPPIVAYGVLGWLSQIFQKVFHFFKSARLFFA